MAVQYARHYRFTVEQYQRLAQDGYPDPHARVELIDGEIVEMGPIGDRHNAFMDRIAELLFRLIGGTANIRVQGSIRIKRRDDAWTSQSSPSLTVSGKDIFG